MVSRIINLRYGGEEEPIKLAHGPNYDHHDGQGELTINYEIEARGYEVIMFKTATIAHLLGTLVKQALQLGIPNPGDWAIYAGSTCLGMLADQVGERQVLELGDNLTFVHQ